MTTTDRATKAPSAAGRPRSAAARGTILAAAYDLVVRRGYAAVTTAEIAVAAGAGKQTIYRWWPGKADLVLDALEHHGAADIDPAGAEAGGLEAFLARVCARATAAGPVLRSLMAEAQSDPLLRRELKTRLIEPRQDALRGALSGADPALRESLVLAIDGALWRRLLLDEPLDQGFVSAMSALARAGGAGGLAKP